MTRTDGRWVPAVVIRNGGDTRTGVDRSGSSPGRAPILAFAAIIITGCASLPQQTVVSRVEQAPAVRIPVPIRCVSLRELPSIPPTNLRPGPDAEQKFRQLIADVDDMREYMIRADAALRGCATEPSPTEGVK